MKTKTTPHGIPLLTQKTFLLTAAGLFVLYGISIVRTISDSALYWPSEAVNELYIYAFHTAFIGIIMPALIFGLAYYVNRQMAVKMTRAFHASLAAFMFVILNVALGYLFAYVLFYQQLGYGDIAAEWTSPWIQFIPAVVAAVTVSLLTLRLLKVDKKMKREQASRRLQMAFMTVVGSSFVAMTAIPAWHTYRQDSAATDDLTVTFVNMALSMLASLLFGLILFFLTNKTLSTVTRWFLAMVYLLIGAFILMAVSGLMDLVGWYSFASEGFMSILPPVLGLILYVSLVVLQKRRGAF